MERKLKAEPREVSGKGGARKVRATGRVPAVVYGHGEPMTISVDAKELYHLLHTDAGMNIMVDMRIDGDHLLAMPREIQRDHLKGRFIHVDFLRVARDEKISVEVPIHLVGDSPGVKEGGVIEHHLWTLHLECFPQDVPPSLEADVSTLGMNESLKVSDLKTPNNVTVLTSLDEVIVSVVPPQVLRVEEEEEAAAEGAEEGEEAAEGESEAESDSGSGSEG
jgi:large subunit ribosomal protein L25